MAFTSILIFSDPSEDISLLPDEQSKTTQQRHPGNFIKSLTKDDNFVINHAN